MLRVPKRLNNLEKILINKIPLRLIEFGIKAIRTRGTITRKTKNCFFEFFKRKRLHWLLLIRLERQGRFTKAKEEIKSSIESEFPSTYILLKWEATWLAKSCGSDTHSPWSFCKHEIRFLAFRLLATAWKNFVFLSPSTYHFNLERWAQKLASQS